MKHTSMIEGRPAGLLIQFAIPLMIGDMIQQVYAIADTIVVGRLIGVHAFAAVSVAGFFYWLVLVILFGFSHGFGTLMAQRFGARDYDGLRQACAISLWLTLGIGAVLTIIGLVLVRPVLMVMHTPKDILEDAILYLSILFSGIIGIFANTVIAAVFRALGDSKTPLYTFIAASALNIILDIVLVLYTPWGIAVVALTTVGAQSISAMFCLWYLVTHTAMKLVPRDFVPNPATIKELLRLGVPLGARDCIAAIGGSVIQYVINGYGTVFIAGVAAAKKLYSILFIIGNGVEGAIATFVAQNYGAGYFDRINTGVIIARRIMLAGLMIIIPVMFFFGRNVLSLFIAGEDAQSAQVLDAAVNQLRVCLILLPTLYMLFLYRASLQSMGNSVVPMVSGLLEAGLRIAAALILPVFWGEWGVYIAEPIGWLPMALQLYLGYRMIFKQKSNLKTLSQV
jgi:putative MATE family efflux protein